MIRINNIDIESITKESIDMELSPKIILERYNPSNFFKSKETSKICKDLFMGSTLNENIFALLGHVESLKKEYSDDIMIELFKSLKSMDNELYLDILTAIYMILISYNNKKYVEYAYNICDMINNESNANMIAMHDEHSEDK